MRTNPVLRFPATPKPTPAKADLRTNVQRSVTRSIQKLPKLAHLNPDGALLIERSIDDYMPRGPSEGHDAADPHASAANGAAPRRRLKPAHAIRNVERSNELLTAIVTEAWDALVHLKLNAR